MSNGPTALQLNLKKLKQQLHIHNFIHTHTDNEKTKGKWGKI